MTFFKKLVKPVSVVLFLFVSITTNAQNEKKEATIHNTVQLQTSQIFDSLVKIRREFHRNPEVSGQEVSTSKKIANYLKELGLEVKTGIGGNGVIGILHTGKKGKRIAWRADIDAMTSDIPDVVDFQSQNEGVRHICGHDVNTTIALGIANVLVSQKASLTGTVYFIFQPSEENYAGAKAMIADGLFDIIHPEEIYATHIAPMPSNVIATKAEWMFADYKMIKVTFENSNNNEALIAYTKELISSLQNIAPDSKFWDPQSLLDPEIGLGSPNTLFTKYVTVHQNFKINETPNEIAISTYIGSSSIGELDTLLPQLEQKIKNSDYAEKLQTITYSLERANLYNAIDLTEKTMHSIATVYGHDKTILLYGEMPDGRGDDFAYFQQKLPGVYFYLGGSDFEKGIISMPHAPNFAVDETCIKTGVNYFSSMLIDRLIQ